MTINAVIIGSGVGLKHAEAISSTSGAKIIAICEKDKSKHIQLKKNLKK